MDVSSTDNDTVTITSTVADLATASGTPLILGFENVNFNFSTVASPTINAADILDGALTVEQTLTGGGAGVTIQNASDITVNVGDSFTGTATLTQGTGDLTVNGGDGASAITVSGGTTGALVINAGASTTSADGDATTGSVTVTGAALTSAGAVGATTEITTGVTGSTLTVEGTAATTDTTTLSAVTAAGISNTATAIETYNLSGNGAAVTYTLNAVGLALDGQTVNITGDQDVGLTGTGAQLSGATIVDASTGTSTLTVSLTQANQDFDSVTVDNIVVASVNGLGDGLTVNSTGTSVTVNDNAGNRLDLISDAAASTATDSITVVGGAAGTVIGNGTAGDGTGTDTFQTVNYSSNLSSGTNTLTATLGSNATTGAVLDIGGSVAVTLDATTTAISVDGSDMTGVLTADTTNAATVIGGAGNDVLTADVASTTITGNGGSDDLNVTGALLIANTVAGITVNGGDGNDDIDVTGAASGTVINAGDGNDTLNYAIGTGAPDIATTQDVDMGGGNDTVTLIASVTGDFVGGLGTDTLNLAGASAATFTGFETVTANAVTGADAGSFNGAGFVLTGDAVAFAAAGVNEVDLSFINDDAAGTLTWTTGLDAGVFGTSTGITFTGLTNWANVVTGTSNADQLIGGDGADQLTGGAGNDIINGGDGADLVLVGGDGNDTITGGEGGDTITGGNGVDTIILTEATAATDTVVIALADTGDGDEITSFTAGATDGDVIDLDGSTLASGEVAGATTTTDDGVDNIAAGAAVSSAATHAALNVAGDLVYVFTTDIGGTVDFTTATDAQIVTAIEAALEDTTANVLSGNAGTAVAAADNVNAALLLAFTDGTNTAVVHYAEGGAAEADFNGELSVIAVLQGVSADALTHDNFFA